MSRPPGWYADASVPGHERWWDGGTWSHVTRPAPQSSPSVSGGLMTVQGRQGAGFSLAGPVRTTLDGVPLADLWRRAVARAIDAVLVFLATLAVGYPYLVELMDVTNAFLLELEQSGKPVNLMSSVTDLYDRPGYLSAALGLSLVQLILRGLYHVAFLATRGATPGKLAVGVRVRSWDVEGLPGWHRALRRWLASDVMSVLPVIGFPYRVVDSLWPLGDRRRQGLHDKWAGTVVVRTTTEPRSGSVS